jgi:hypothetical protein
MAHHFQISTRQPVKNPEWLGNMGCSKSRFSVVGKAVSKG